MQADQKPVIWTVVIAAIVLALVLVGGFVSVGNKVDNQLSVMNTKLGGLDIDEQAIANAIVAGMPEAPVYPEFPEYMISEGDYEVNLQEAEAERLVMDELNSKDFREALLIAINTKTLDVTLPTANEQKGLEIISYKDIEDAYSVDVDDVTMIVDKGVVTIDFKVQYVLDDDEDLIGKARVTVIYDVYDLVVDDDFEDAEVEEGEYAVFDVTHLYTNLI